MIDVSLLCAAYNAEATITRTVESTLNQRGVSTEVIVVYDACIDNTAETAFIAGARVMPNEGARGQADALNTAARYSTGRYLMQLDADDFLEKDCLVAMVDALDSAPSQIGFVYGDVQYSGKLSMRYQPPPFQRGQFWKGFASLYPFLYRAEAFTAGCRYRSILTIDGKGVGNLDYDFALQLIEWMRWDGLALPGHLVLHYAYTENGMNTLVENPDLLEAFRALWGSQLKVQKL
jgi:glycosyltransferase involved in cell wall biosynthesis